MAAPIAKPTWQKVDPKLRVICNGDEFVNAARAETQGCLKVQAEKVVADVPPLRAAVAPGAAPATKAATKVNDLARTPDVVRVNAFVETRGDVRLKDEKARQGSLAIVELSVDEVQALADRGDVALIQRADNLKVPRPIKLAARAKPPAAQARKVGLANQHKGGEKVLIGIVDVEGFDFTHVDFLKAKDKTRFLRIWDQGGAHRPPPSQNGHGRFDYGAELLSSQLDAAMAEAPQVKVSPHDLEPQSQMVPGAHGTHVTSIAAGNHGVCNKADIVAVLVSLPEEDVADRRRSFYDSTRLIDAIEYLLGVADELKKPISINVSLGTNGHAHDGSSALDRWLDAWLDKPGRAITVAAGNAGQEREESPGDMGYVFGRIHTSGKVAAAGLHQDIEWMVAGDGIMDVSENEMEIWYESQDRFAVHVKPPGASEWIGPINPREHLENIQLPDRTMLSVYNDLYHPANGHNCVAIYLTPFWGRTVQVGVTAGKWMVRLTGVEVRDGRFHAWIERDDPSGFEGAAYFPSYFSAKSTVDESSVSSLACGQRIISVANLDELEQQVNISSSQGPTRDGRPKPDLAAPGTGVLAANGFGRPDDPWIPMTGTSMASPYVAGVVGLMLAVEPRLRASQINGILKATARPLAGKSYSWVNDCGFGVIDAQSCVRDAAESFKLLDVKERFE